MHCGMLGAAWQALLICKSNHLFLTLSLSLSPALRSKVLEDPASEPAPAPLLEEAAPAPAPELDLDGNFSMMPAPMSSRANTFQSIVEGAADLAQVDSSKP